MVYALIVNAEILGESLYEGVGNLLYSGSVFGTIYIATAISAVIGTLLIGLIANLPLAQASGMGLNAFFVYTICISLGFTYTNALVLVFFDGILLIILSISGLRKKIFESIPHFVRIAIFCGIGLFLAFLGLQSAGFVIPSETTGVTLASFNLLLNDWSSVMPLLIMLFLFFVIVILSKNKIKGSIVIGLISGMCLYYLLGLSVPGFYENMNIDFLNPIDAFVDFGNNLFGVMFTNGFDFSAYIENNSIADLVIAIITTSLAFAMVDMFDTIGTLFGVAKAGKLLTSTSELIGMTQAFLADSVATSLGAIFGTSTVTTYGESLIGIGEGGKTGLSAVFCAFFFLIAMFLSPIAQFVPSCVTSATLLYVGVLSMAPIKEIDWGNLEIAVPAF